MVTYPAADCDQLLNSLPFDSVCSFKIEILGALMILTCTIPSTHPQSLLSLLIESRHDEHEHRANATLQEPEEESLRVDTLEIVCASCTHQTCAP